MNILAGQKEGKNHSSNVLKLDFKIYIQTTEIEQARVKLKEKKLVLSFLREILVDSVVVVCKRGDISC